MACHIISGPMFSGKTTNMLNEINRIRATSDLPIMQVTHSNDKIRTQSTDCLVSNTGGSLNSKGVTNAVAGINAVSCSSLDDINPPNDSILLIDEGQFFANIVENVRRFLNNNITVYIYGLVADVHQKKFGNITDCIPMCDSLTMLRATCVYCVDDRIGRNAPHTIRTDINASDFSGANAYAAVCRKHLYKNVM